MFSKTGYPIDVTYYISHGKWVSKKEIVNLYAKWEEDNISEVSFYDNYSSINPEKILQLEYGKAPTFDVTVPKRDGYTFIGYFPEKHEDFTDYDAFRAEFDPTLKLLEKCIYDSSGKLLTCAYESTMLNDPAIENYISKDGTSWK